MFAHSLGHLLPVGGIGVCNGYLLLGLDGEEVLVNISESVHAKMLLKVVFRHYVQHTRFTSAIQCSTDFLNG